ncbi:MAG: ATP-binding protein [Cellulosilyticaceae bacterium]
MKLRLKIISIFLVSIAISVIVFFYTTSYLVEHVAWKGINFEMMDKAVAEAQTKISLLSKIEENKIQIIGEEVAEKYQGMIIEAISKDESWYLTTAKTQQIKTVHEMLNHLSEHNKYQQKQWSVAKEVTTQNGESMYVLVIVPQEHFRLLYWHINGDQGLKVTRTIVSAGFMITLTVSTFCAFIFSRSMLKRFNHLYHGIAQFGLGNTKVTVDDKKKDEIGELVHTFNQMAYKINEQVEVQKEQENKRRELVSNISHDLRTPLSSIVGYTESLRNGIYDDEAEQNQYLEIIYKKALYTEKLLGELLDFSRLECGALTLYKEKVDLAELTRAVLIEYLPSMEERQIELGVDIEEGIALVEIDKAQISRVIRNLLDNAIKYGSQGKIIRVSIKRYSNRVELWVMDKGQGIPKDALEHIFERFYRVDKSRNTKEGGMGLGLAIVDEIIKKHKGTISVASETGDGTTITVVIPIEKS